MVSQARQTQICHIVVLLSISKRWKTEQPNSSLTPSSSLSLSLSINPKFLSYPSSENGSYIYTLRVSTTPNLPLSLSKTSQLPIIRKWQKMAATCTLKLSNHSTSPPNNRIQEFQRFPVGEKQTKPTSIRITKEGTKKDPLTANKKQEKNRREPPPQEQQQQQ
jgi:hypothetical protein